MIRQPPRTNSTDTLFPYTTLFRSLSGQIFPARGGRGIGVLLCLFVPSWRPISGLPIAPLAVKLSRDDSFSARCRPMALIALVGASEILPDGGLPALAALPGEPPPARQAARIARPPKESAGGN